MVPVLFFDLGTAQVGFDSQHRKSAIDP